MKEILNLSGADLQRLTQLSSTDVHYLLKTVSGALRKNSAVTGNTSVAHAQQHACSLGVILFLNRKVAVVARGVFDS